MSQSTIFQLCWDGSSWVEPVHSNDSYVLLKDITPTDQVYIWFKADKLEKLETLVHLIRLSDKYLV